VPYKIPEANPQQEVTPPELEALTAPIREVLARVAQARERDPNLRVYAADDKKWLRVGFRLEFGSGDVQYTCARVKEAFDEIPALRYRSYRNLVAFLLEQGRSIEDSLRVAQDRCKADQDREPNNHYFASLKTEAWVYAARHKIGSPASALTP
jgi:hypothetical protein